MTPLLAVPPLLLMLYLFWLQRQDVAEQDRQREVERQRSSALGPGPDSC